MRTYTAVTDADTLPDLDDLAAWLRARSDVMFVESDEMGLNVITAKGHSLRFIHHLENHQILWTCYVE